MRLPGKSDQEKMRPERDKKILLNIPVDGTDESSGDEIYRGTSLSDHDRSVFELGNGIKNINIYNISTYNEQSFDDSASSSEDEEKLEEIKSQLIAKSPDRVKDEKKKEGKNDIRPYPIAVTRSGLLQCGGNVSLSLSDNYTNRTNYYQIPLPVADFVPEVNIEEEVQRFCNDLSEPFREKLFGAIDARECSNDPSGNPRQRFKDSDICNSPDSSYGTMSPASVPPISPYSIYSPNPVNEKVRCPESESSSSSDYDLGPSELNIDINKSLIPPPRTNSISIGPPPRASNKVLQTACVQMPRISRPIYPDSQIIVQELGLKDPAVVRLKKSNLLKQGKIRSEWLNVINESQPLETLLNLGRGKNSEIIAQQIRSEKEKLRKNLIELIMAGPKTEYFYETLFEKVKLYNRSYPDILTENYPNIHMPLYAAAVLKSDCPIIARLIVDLQERIGNVDDKQNTMLHYLVRHGDSHAQVLSELLNSKKFDVNQKNIRSKTALHTAVEVHRTKSCLACIKQLVKHGANLKLKDFDGKTALHLAVTVLSHDSDSLLLKALLQSKTADFDTINIMDNDRNTALHLAASRNELPLAIQKDIIDQLVTSKAMYCIRNNQEKTALMLVALERKEVIKSIFHRKV